MTNPKLIERLLESNDVESKAAAIRILKQIRENIIEELVAGNNVHLPGLCTLHVKTAAPRPYNGINGSPSGIKPACKTVKIKAAEPLQTLIAG